MAREKTSKKKSKKTATSSRKNLQKKSGGARKNVKGSNASRKTKQSARRSVSGGTGGHKAKGAAGKVGKAAAGGTRARKKSSQAKGSKASSSVGKTAGAKNRKERRSAGAKLTASERRKFKSALIALRDRILDEINFLAGDNLNRSQRDMSGDLSSYSFHMADQGTDNFDREFALNLVSNEQDALYEINEALGRIDNGTYGVCENCGGRIEKGRLAALPFARLCVKCQSEMERQRIPVRRQVTSISGRR